MARTKLADNSGLREEESLFSRDIDGRLLRLDKVTAESLDQEVTVAIDDRVIRVKRAIPAVDPQGRPRLDAKGRIIPRATTIFDAAAALGDALIVYGPDGKPLKDEKGRAVFRPRVEGDTSMTRTGSFLNNPIPVLCHLPHLEPVAVCRACVVEISRVKRGERRTERKLLPACQHRVEDAMEVRTIATSPRVESAVKTVVELLLADHPFPCAKEQRHVGSCELEALATRLGVNLVRFPSRPARPIDNSSLLISVDHSSCIMCDRCVRGCNDIRDNQVIGRMLKGYDARIAFDLDAPMGKSTCVSCGECMISCPTGALVYRAPIESKIFEDLDPPAERVDVNDLLARSHKEIRRAFANVSPTFLEWNTDWIVRRRFAQGQIICRQGEYGSTAFFIEKGSAEIFISTPRAEDDDGARGGLLGLFSRRARGKGQADAGANPDRTFIPVDAPLVLPADRPTATLVEGDLFGEMACLNSYPRSATVRAGAGGCIVLEMQRNVLDIMRRSRSYREEMDRRIRKRVIKVVLAHIPLLSGVQDSFLEELSRLARYRRCEPGEVVIRQGDLAAGGGDPEAEGLFLIRSGFLKIVRSQPGGQEVLNYRGPGHYVGEIALLSGLSPDDFGPEGAELAADLAEIRRLSGGGRRVATCVALDHVELVRIAPEDFRRILQATPRAVRRSIVADALGRLRQNAPQARDPGVAAATGFEAEAARNYRMRELLDKGLIGAHSLLVLDLIKCTRCDECTKACSDTHGGVTRLIREGIRFDRYLVASSCRSCHDPVCLIGCPVDAIHRRAGSNEIWIEDTCIGCGKCAENCPYGNINMELREAGGRPGPDNQVAVARKATTCDQCRSLKGHLPNCVVACPHDAAHRMEGFELFELVQRATTF